MSECSVPELKNDLMCSGFTEVLVRSDNEPSIWVLKESWSLGHDRTKMEDGIFLGEHSGKGGRLYISKADIMKHGLTEGCLGCRCLAPRRRMGEA